MHFLLISCVVYWSEHKVDEWIKSDNHQLAAQSVFEMSWLYQNLTSVGWRKPAPKYTVLVEINKEKDEKYIENTMNCSCGASGHRAQMAKLLNKIAGADPDVIVLDLLYQEKACPQDDPGTKVLSDTINELSQHISIIVGRGIQEDEGNKYPKEIEQTASYNQDSYVDENYLKLKPALIFYKDPNSKFFEGIANRDPDVRKVPLKWDVIKNNSDTKPTIMHTMALSAAEAYRTDLTSNPRLKKLLEENINPFISFIKLDQFKRIFAGNLLAADSTYDYSIFRNKIVIIGESDSFTDNHDSPIGLVPGFVIQANYIEALLDDRLLEPKILLDYILGFIIFAAVYYVAIIEEEHWLKLIFWEIVVLGLAYVFLYFFIAPHFGLYINPVTISGLGLMMIFSHGLFPKVPHISESTVLKNKPHDN